MTRALHQRSPVRRRPACAARRDRHLERLRPRAASNPRATNRLAPAARQGSPGAGRFEVSMLKFIRKALKHSLRLLPDSYYARMITYYPATAALAVRARSAPTRRASTTASGSTTTSSPSPGPAICCSWSSAAMPGDPCGTGRRTAPGTVRASVGFDTFTGLPEKWQGMGRTADEGMWGLDGKPPTSGRSPRVLCEGPVSGLPAWLRLRWAARSTPAGR